MLHTSAARMLAIMRVGDAGTASPSVRKSKHRQALEHHVEACLAPAQVKELRTRTQSLPDDYLVVLVGDLVTEEALPTYMAMLNTLDGVRDETGAAPTPWARSASCSRVHAGRGRNSHDLQTSCGGISSIRPRGTCSAAYTHAAPMAPWLMPPASACS